MPMIDAFIAELTHEAGTTRALLERVPDDKLSWKPHEKSFSVAELAGHTANLIGWAPLILATEELDLGAEFEMPPTPESTAELVQTFDAKIAEFKEAASGKSDEELMVSWVLRNRDKVLIDMPRAAHLRSFVLNHFYHHRGQLSVYLRLLDVPLPPIYGPTADDTAGFDG